MALYEVLTREKQLFMDEPSIRRLSPALSSQGLNPPFTVLCLCDGLALGQQYVTRTGSRDLYAEYVENISRIYLSGSGPFGPLCMTMHVRLPKSYVNETGYAF